MAQFDFPSSPSTNQTYTANGVSYKWDGVSGMELLGEE